MRLVCPNCGAQYEVDDRVIPDSGRDVQCSNCGHAWFQRGAGWQHESDQETAESGVSEPEAIVEDEDRGEAESQAVAETQAPAEQEVEAEPPAMPAEEPALEVEPSPDQEPEAEPEPEPETEAEPEADIEVDIEIELEAVAEPEAELEPEPAVTPERPRHELDEETRAILREEAERELAAREHEAGSVEMQEELGLEETGTADNDRGLKARMARLRGIDTEEETELDTGPRRDLLPDIEEINSSLNSVNENDDYDDFAENAARGRSGFGRGFGLVLLLAVLAVILYLLAPQIGALIPALAPALEAYMGFVDTLREQIDALMQRSISAMQGAAEQ